MQRLRIAIVYNTYCTDTAELPEDRGSAADLQQMMQDLARHLRRLGHNVRLAPLADDVFAFLRRIRRLRPDVIFNMFDDVVPGALYDMRVASLIRTLGLPATGCSELALGLTRQKYLTLKLLEGLGLRIPPCSHLLHSVAETTHYTWQWPIIVHPQQEHAGVGLDRESVVHDLPTLQRQVAKLLAEHRQPVLAQHFLPGREFNVSVLGGQEVQVLPLAEVDYSQLPAAVPPIMSYAAKWLEDTVEYQQISVRCPAEVEPALAERIRTAALRAFQAVCGYGYVRVDMRLDEHEQPCILEINCNPCLDEGMGIARSAEHGGLPFPQLLERLLQIALEPKPNDPLVLKLPQPSRAAR